MPLEFKKTGEGFEATGKGESDTIMAEETTTPAAAETPGTEPSTTAANTPAGAPPEGGEGDASVETPASAGEQSAA